MIARSVPQSGPRAIIRVFCSGVENVVKPLDGVGNPPQARLRKQEVRQSRRECSRGWSRQWW